MNLLEAPFRKSLKIAQLMAEGEEYTVLVELGLGVGETIEKVHTAPLGDPVGLRIGEQIFSLRKEHCRKILIQVLA